MERKPPSDRDKRPDESALMELEEQEPADLDEEEGQAELAEPRDEEEDPDDGERADGEPHEEVVPRIRIRGQKRRIL